MLKLNDKALKGFDSPILLHAGKQLPKELKSFKNKYIEFVFKHI